MSESQIIRSPCVPRVAPESTLAYFDYLHVLQHAGNFDLVARHVDDDVVLPHPDPGHTWQVSELFTVSVPDLCDVIQMLVRLPQIAVVYRVIRPSLSSHSSAY